MADASFHDRIAAIAGTEAAEQIIELLGEEAAKRCRDTDCIRLRPHSSLAWHLWRHVPVPPLSPGLFGRRCLTCGKPTWRRIHRTGAGL